MPKKVFLLVLAAALVGLGAWIAWQQGYRHVKIVTSEGTYAFTTRAKTVGEVLSEAGLQPNDEIFSFPQADAKVVSDMEISLVQAQVVQILADGVWHTVQVQDDLPGNWLAEAGIKLFPEDEVRLAGNLVQVDVPLDDPRPVLQVVRSLPVRGQLQDEQISFSSSAPTLGAALADEGISIRAADRIEPGLTTWLVEPVQIVISPAREVVIQSGAYLQTVLTSATTVGKALAAAGLPLQGLDYSIPGDKEPVPEDGWIRRVKVWEEVLVEQKPLPFETLTQPDPTLEIDQQTLIQAGQYGVSAQRIRVRYEDGVEITRTLDAEWVAVPPRPRIVGYGTNIVIRTISTADGTFEYWRAIQAYATSYSNCRLGIPNYCDDRTASGEFLKKGMVAVIRSWYNVMKGQYVYIPGYGQAKINDIGGGIAGRNWIDLGYNDDDWISWHQNVTVYFLTPVPPPDKILYILP